MASLVAIRQALAHTIKSYAATELNTYATVNDMVDVPAIIIEPLNADYTVAFQRGSDTWEFHIFVLVGRGSEGEAQNLLDELITGAGPNSIREILYDHDDLGLPDTTATVHSMRGYGGSFEIAKIPHIGAVLKVRVDTDGAA